MEDCQIVEFYWARSEKAISETADKYGQYCYSIACNILHSSEDSEECVNDTYFRLRILMVTSEMPLAQNLRICARGVSMPPVGCRSP